jgi:hypothetical protein
MTIVWTFLPFVVVVDEDMTHNMLVVILDRRYRGMWRIKEYMGPTTLKQVTPTTLGDYLFGRVLEKIFNFFFQFNFFYALYNYVKVWV